MALVVKEFVYTVWFFEKEMYSRKLGMTVDDSDDNNFRQRHSVVLRGTTEYLVW